VVATDEPLMQYLGVRAENRRFQPTKYEGTVIRRELAKIAADPHALDRSRLSVLLANANQTQTLTATHVLWAMYGLVPAGTVQRAHRHQSVALDLCVDASDGAYTMLGSSIDDRGEIVNPVRVDWSPGGAFTTPPGMWHAHHNDAQQDAWVVPIQDAGLQTYMRSLDIRFAQHR
jgi:gentisate 1,2-dioxygenase